MRTRLPIHRPLWIAFAFMALGVAWQLLIALTNWGGSLVHTLTNDWLYMAVEFVAIGVCATGAMRHRSQRLAWLLVTAALVAWSVGDLLWAVWLDGLRNPPYPSPADVSYLLMYPVLYGGLMVMMRSRMRHAAMSQWLDGGVVAMTVGAIAAALVFSDVVGSTGGGHFVAEAVTVAYPVGDFILLMFVAVGFTLAGWRPGGDWSALGIGVALMALGDIVYVDNVANGTYVSGTLLNAVYLTAFALMAVAAWIPPRRSLRPARDAPHTILMTLLAAAFALALLVLAAFTPMTALAVGLAAGALVLATIRSALTYIENVRMLRAESREAVTDALTKLGNRRRLLGDLEQVFARPDGAATLAFFDLNGFKRYNDSFGHLAGDALLARLASALQTSVNGHGAAYRLGGDEFCVLLDGRHPRHDRLIASARAALSERGHGFDVSSALGVTLIPDEATSPTMALRRADERMYADKGRSHRSPTRDVLMQLLNERTPGLLEHVSGVTEFTAAVASHLRLDAEQLDETLRAAELHDIGKLAIPDEIINKPGPLSADEWEFMKQHSVIGQRILTAAPALAPVGTLVRATHERWDGKGYPDGLSAQSIPLGARIIAVCDAYDAMTSDRVYQHARTPAEALAELRLHAGTQFDPEVVDALGRHIVETGIIAEQQTFPALAPDA